MKIAIHYSPWSFAPRWIQYCESHRLQYKVVNCYDSDIVHQLTDCGVLMWHHHHSLIKDVLFAKQLLYSQELAGKKVFPDFRTTWHFDDKVGQKYLLESLNAPIAATYAFYSEHDAIKWLKSVDLPKVFKLRTGAGSSNVRLVESIEDGRLLVKKMFSAGMSQYNAIHDFRESIRRLRHSDSTYKQALKSFFRMFKSTEYAKFKGNEKSYILFQDFLPNNLFDTRVIVIGRYAFGIRRLVRKGDFRASGSGQFLFEKALIDERCVKIAFDVTSKMGSQCAAYDFVYDLQNNPKIVEVNYGFTPAAYESCPGYWDSNLIWYEGSFNPYGWMVENLISDSRYEFEIQ
jgi:glutathione synthase/RimK-type ligase-like ATP-grasp enzyme